MHPPVYLPLHTKSLTSSQSEFAHPYDVLKDEFDILVASPSGGEAPMDPASVDAAKDDKISVDFLEHKKALWKSTKKLSAYIGHAKEIDAIYYVGGHGPMNDLAKDTHSADLILDFAKHNRPVAAVCHGPAALTHPKLKQFMADTKVTGFSNSEEKAVGKVEICPFSLEDKLQEMTGGYEKGDDWAEHVVISKDGLLLTGQNPASAAGLARKVREAVFGELTKKN